MFLPVLFYGEMSLRSPRLAAPPLPLSTIYARPLPLAPQVGTPRGLNQMRETLSSSRETRLSDQLREEA